MDFSNSIPPRVSYKEHRVTLDFRILSMLLKTERDKTEGRENVSIEVAPSLGAAARP